MNHYKCHKKSCVFFFFFFGVVKLNFGACTLVGRVNSEGWDNITRTELNQDKMRQSTAHHQLPVRHESSPKYRIHSPHLYTPNTAILAPWPMSCRDFHASLPVLRG